MAFKSKSTSGTDVGTLSGLLEVAAVGRAHGVRGEVALYPVTNRLERFDDGSVLVTAAGPRAVASARPDGNRWLVRFEGIDDRDAAAALTGTTVYAEPLDDPDELWVHELCGATVVDQRGNRTGVVTAVVANPAADLLELDTGDLVPLTFIVRCEPGVVYVEVPDGLFELDER
ncbi:ribosome maturation factor RimM [Candidatus Poriferisodalis sp.]|uniref:ribosome maturation factor RimM n=1 Tax=Candidatus Poriferisodalis sp. TaxID=3101277 RepID=UPI003B01176B